MTRAVTRAVPRALPETASWPSTTSSGENVRSSAPPSPAPSSSTATWSPSATRYCFPPLWITAYTSRRRYQTGLLEQLGVEDDPPALAGRARRRQRLDQPLRDPLAGHLHQPELGDVEHLAPRLVPGEGLAKGADDVVAVGHDLHVDEVDDDDAADVAEPELAGDLLGRLQVVAVDGLLEVGRPDVLARVDVDHRQRLGPFDDQRAPARQPHLLVDRLVELLVDVEALEDRQPLGRLVVELHPVCELGADRCHVVAAV